MTESMAEAQAMTGRTRIILAAIGVAGTIGTALISGLPGKMGWDTEASPAEPVATAAPDPAPATPKKWRIAGTVEPADGQGPQEVALHLIPVEDAQQARTDDQGRFVFLNVPEGVYSLLVEPLDDGDRKMKVTVEKQTNARVEDLRVPEPLKITITEQ